ncbi:MAG TPA: sigma-E factor regulatory protein RseB domain-containing protein [Candidatus Eremiobacteraceae bacterium]|nr:sigma-E factor regulatory protein RseB domain-containing protein [Candidatus Eremiobacteraceae bacterium]
MRRSQVRKAFAVAAVAFASIALAYASATARSSTVAAAVAAAATAAPASTSSPSAADLLRQASRSDDHISYTGTTTSVIYNEHGADSTVVRVDHAAPSKWRMWYVAPADAYGRLIVSDEATTYQYEPKTATVYSESWSEAPALTLDLDTAKVLRNYVSEIGASADVAGRKAITISLVSKYSGVLAQRVWVDADTKIVLERETYDSDGSISSKTSFDTIRFVNDLPKELFDLSVPAGMHVEPGTTFGRAVKSLDMIQSDVGFTVISPRYVPEGFTFDQASLGSRNGIQTVQLLYTDGLRDFSVFENATDRLPDLESPRQFDVDDTTGITDEIDGETLLSWNANGLNITLVGDMPAKLLARIGASVRP